MGDTLTPRVIDCKQSVDAKKNFLRTSKTPEKPANKDYLARAGLAQTAALTES